MPDIEQSGESSKLCRTCGIMKELRNFHHRTRKSGKVYTSPDCTACTQTRKEAKRQENLEANLARQREYASKNSAAAVERVREWRSRPGNKERKNESERARRALPDVKAKNAEYNAGWWAIPENKERINAMRRKNRRSDPGLRARERALQREYYSRPDVAERERAKRKEVQSSVEWRDKFNARRRKRYAADPNYLCALKCRALVVRVAEKAKTKKDGRTADILGYSAKELRQRMECQFLPGMSWDNYGYDGWHIDHKKPIAAFIAQGIRDIRLINMLSNLQPLWAKDNQAKSSNWPQVVANDNKDAAREAA